MSQEFLPARALAISALCHAAALLLFALLSLAMLASCSTKDSSEANRETRILGDGVHGPQQVPAGGTLEILATDPGSVADFEAFCRQTGNELVEHSQDDKVFRFVIKHTAA